MIQKFLTLLVVLMMLVPSVVAAPSEKTNTKDLKINDQSKGQMKEVKDDKVKGLKSSSSDIVVDEKGKNHIKLKDSKPSKDKKEHKKVKVSFDSNELKSIDVDGDGKFGVLEITDDGVVIDQYIATSAQLTAGIDMTFSEVEVNGFSGYRSETFAAQGSGIINTADVSGNYTQTISVDGVIPDHVPGIPHTGLVFHYPLMGNLTDVSGNNLVLTESGIGSTGYNSTYGLLSNGTKIFTVASTDLFNTTDFTMGVKYKYRSNDELSSSQYIKISGKTNIGYLNINVSTYYDTTYTGGRKYTDKNFLNYMQSNSMLVSGTGLPDTKTYYYHNMAAYQISASNTNIVNVSAPAIIGSTDGYYRDAVWYNRKLSSDEVLQYHAGASGISVKQSKSESFVPYDTTAGTEVVISTGGTSTTVDYIDTSGGTRNVTIKTYYTADTTLSTETSTNDFYNASVVFSPSVALTNGTIARLIPPNYTGTAVLDSNNTNTVMTQNRTHYTIYTGTLTAGSWVGYNVSVPNNADHGMWLDRLMQWVSGVGWNFVGTAPTDYTDDISDEITVTVS